MKYDDISLFTRWDGGTPGSIKPVWTDLDILTILGRIYRQTVEEGIKT